MGLTFPTRPDGRGGAATPGQPTRASHCHCKPGPVIPTGEDTCLRCGRYLKATIAETWQARAERVAQDRAR